MGDVTTLIIRPMSTMFGDLGTDDIDMVIDIYERQLAGFADKVLTKAFDEVTSKFFPSKRLPWPPPAAFRKAAERITADDNSRRAATAKPINNEAAADRAMTTDLAREAARDGWVLGLRNFVVRTGDLPRAGQIGKIVADMRYLERCAAGEINMGKQHRDLMLLAQSMVEKNHALASKVLASN